MTNGKPRPQRLPLVFIFLRFPKTGTVKTRLAAQSSPEEACALYRAMVEMLRDRLLPGAGHDYELCFYYTPGDSEQDCREWLFPRAIEHGCRLAAQPEGSLENRLEEAGRLSRELKAPAVVFIGSDCVDISPLDISQAIGRLASEPSVIGPAKDGGFWLLALREWQEGLFRGISYSRAGTFGELKKRLTDLGMEPACIDERIDLDTVQDINDQPNATRVELEERAQIFRHQ